MANCFPHVAWHVFGIDDPERRWEYFHVVALTQRSNVRRFLVPSDPSRKVREGLTQGVQGVALRVRQMRTSPV